MTLERSRFFVCLAFLASVPACDLRFSLGLSDGSGGGGGGGGAGCPAYQPSSPAVVVHGTVRLAQDSTPHPGTQPTINVLLCGGPSEVAHGWADSLGHFRMAFQADCAQTYALGVAWFVTDSTGTVYRESIVRVSGISAENPPLFGLTMPADACAAGDWQVDIWVNSALYPH